MNLSSVNVAKKSPQSAHISDMVSKQKAAKKKPPKLTIYLHPNARYPATSNCHPESLSEYPQSAHISDMVSKQKAAKKKPPKLTIYLHPNARYPATSNCHLESLSEYTQSDHISDMVSKQKAAKKKPPKLTFYLHPNARYPATSNYHPESLSEYPQSDHISDMVSKQKAAKKKPSKLTIYLHPNARYPATSNCHPESLSKYPNRHSKFLDRLYPDSYQTSNTNVSQQPVWDALSSLPSSSSSVKFTRTGDPLVDLKYFAEINKLGDVKVDIAQIYPRKNRFFFSCKIKIVFDNGTRGGAETSDFFEVGTKYTYSSYLNDFLNPLDAQNFCCEEALSDLIPKFRRKSLMTSSEKDILERIPPMLEERPHGIWARQLKDDYIDKYNEVLPEDWLEIIGVRPRVSPEKISEDFILRHCQLGDASQKGQVYGMAMPLDNVSVPSNTIQSGEDGRLIAHVTCVVSAGEIWCQQTGTKESEVFADMMQRLQVYYEEHMSQLTPKNISVSGYYTAKYDDSFYRVRAVNVNGTEVDCFFIDCGNELTLPRNDIYHLKREYATTQAQAFVCRLYGLEELYEGSSDSQSLNNLYEKPVIIEIALEASSKNSLNDALPVFMYDFETRQSISRALIPKLTMELSLPHLQKEGINEVFVSNVEPNGDVYVQVRTRGFDNWLKLKRQTEKRIDEQPPREILYKPNRSESQGKLYFYKRTVDSSWFRIQLIDWSPNGDLAQIYFVDDGHTDVINVAAEDLYPLEALDNILNNYPHQAVRVKMQLDQIPKNFVHLVSQVLVKDQPVLLRIMGTSEDNFLLVKLFQRNSDGELFCINTFVALEVEMKKEVKNNATKGKTTQMIGSECVASTGALKCNSLPKIGEFFKVFIPVALSPYNFFMQPIESKKQLNEMMEKLQKRFEKV